MKATSEILPIVHNVSYGEAVRKLVQDASALITAAMESTIQGTVDKDHRDGNAVADAIGNLLVSVSVLAERGVDINPKRVDTAREKAIRKWRKQLGVDWG